MIIQVNQPPDHSEMQRFTEANSNISCDLAEFACMIIVSSIIYMYTVLCMKWAQFPTGTALSSKSAAREI